MMPTQPSGYGPSFVVMQQPTMGSYAPEYLGPPGQPMPMQQAYPPPQPTMPISNHNGGWQSPNTICPPELEYLIPLDKAFMTQKVDGWEAVTGFHRKNRYTIVNEQGEPIYMLQEDSGWLGRAFFGSSRSFTIRVTDRNGTEAITLQRPIQFIGDQVKVFSAGNLLGSIERQVCTCTPEFLIYDATGRTVLRISGPLCMYGFEHKFTIYSATHDCQVGEIKKQWSGFLREVFSNADTFGFSFPLDLDVKVKALLLAAAILIDFAYFESHN